MANNCSSTRPSLIVFSDIDGTLIDFETYAWDAAADTIAALRHRHIPIVLCSSKTFAEQQFYRKIWGIPDPCIVENGSAIFIPEGYFKFPFTYHRTISGFQVIELGIRVEQIRKILEETRQAFDLDVQGYGDLSVDEVSEVTGLNAAAAARARQRDYSETIVTRLHPETQHRLRIALDKKGLNLVSGGKFHTITAKTSDKGQAVTHLSHLFRRHLDSIITLGLGDSANDAPLLAVVDKPYLMQKPGGVWEDIGVSTIKKVAAIGPTGWIQVMNNILAQIDP